MKKLFKLVQSTCGDEPILQKSIDALIEDNTRPRRLAQITIPKLLLYQNPSFMPMLESWLKENAQSWEIEDAMFLPDVTVRWNPYAAKCEEPTPSA